MNLFVLHFCSVFDRNAHSIPGSLRFLFVCFFLYRNSIQFCFPVLIHNRCLCECFSVRVYTFTSIGLFWLRFVVLYRLRYFSVFFLFFVNLIINNFFFFCFSYYGFCFTIFSYSYHRSELLFRFFRFLKYR